MKYESYTARVELSAEDGAFAGPFADLDDIVGFHADTVPGLVAAFHEAVND
ncbi:MAG: hypothetical protein ACRYGP_14000 [Janthinobacterium lividum]